MRGRPFDNSNSVHVANDTSYGLGAGLHSSKTSTFFFDVFVTWLLVIH